MTLPKSKNRSTLELIRTDEGNDSLETIIRQAIGKEPLVSFSRSGDYPVQWIQLLHALDQQDFPGWPLLTPLKVQMQKCEKCSKEFCSSINYRRHIRVHHRLRNLDKDSGRNRELIKAYWDKLGEDDMKEIFSFKNMAMQEVSGSTIVNSLTALVRKSGYYALPQSCLAAGSALLDILQSRPSTFPMLSDGLFTILDDASERTFLCGPVLSVRKYIFDGEAAKIGLETKNLVAFTSFLIEQKLVEAWVADKDAEALKWQKLLMEEEELALQRQIALLEKKRQKKLRQRELKAKLFAFESMVPSDAPSAYSESSSEPCQSGNEEDIDISETPAANDGDTCFETRHVDNESACQVAADEAPEVLIGSISVAIGLDSTRQNLDKHKSEVNNFSGQMANLFLQSRWRETIEAEHVKLILFPNCATDQK